MNWICKSCLSIVRQALFSSEGLGPVVVWCEKFTEPRENFRVFSQTKTYFWKIYLFIFFMYQGCMSAEPRGIASSFINRPRWESKKQQVSWLNNPILSVHRQNSKLPQRPELLPLSACHTFLYNQRLVVNINCFWSATNWCVHFEYFCIFLESI